MNQKEFNCLYRGEWGPLVANEEQLEILQHTQKVRFYCGGSKDMDELVKNGLMEYAGKKSFVPDSYYTLTAEGRKCLNSLLAQQR